MPVMYYSPRSTCIAIEEQLGAQAAGLGALDRELAANSRRLLTVAESKPELDVGDQVVRRDVVFAECLHHERFILGLGLHSQRDRPKDEGEVSTGRREKEAATVGTHRGRSAQQGGLLSEVIVGDEGAQPAPDRHAAGRWFLLN